MAKETMKSFFAKFARSPGAKLFCIVPESPFLSTTLISCLPRGMDEKVPPEPMVPIGLLSRNTSDPLFQPRIRMLATSVTGGLFVGAASIVAEGGLFNARADVVVPELLPARCCVEVPGPPGGSSTIGNVLGPLACTEMVSVCVVYPGYENSISCLPGRNLILQ
jgi:hypothetical protein